MMDYFRCFDVLLLTETFQLRNSNLRDFYCFERLAEKPGAGRPSGGLTIAIKPHLKPKELYTSLTCLAVETLVMNFICCYFNPTLDITRIAEDLVLAISSVNLQKPTIIGGDFNARFDLANDEKSSDLVEFLGDFGFYILNRSDEVTYRSSNGCSTIDLIFTNTLNHSLIVDVQSDAASLRKHLPVKVNSKTNLRRVDQENVPKLSRQIVVDRLSGAEMDGIESSINNGEINTAYSRLVSETLSAVNHVIEIKRFRGLLNDPECARLKKRVLSLLHFLPSRPWLQNQYNEAKHQLKVRLKAVKEEKRLAEEEKRLSEAESRPWKLNPRRNGQFSCPIPLERWHLHFSQLLNPYPAVQHEIDEYWYLDTPEREPLNRDFTYTEVECNIRMTSNNKAVGEDQIANEHLKSSFFLFGYLWVLLFNFILNTGTIVSSWRNCLIKVLFKGKGDVRDPNAYRGIALLSHPFKLFTRLVARRIYLFVQNTLPDEQYGFRNGRSTADAIKTLRDHVVAALGCPRTPLYAVFVDFKKAFDYVPRHLLIRKLALYHNVRGRILRLLMSIYTVNYIQVFDGLLTSDPIEQTRGVLQGDSLSPLVFILFVADLPGLLRIANEGLLVLTYADDLVFYARSVQEIQRALHVLGKYCDENLLEVNVDKTKVIKFRRGGKICENDEVYYKGRTLEYCKEYEYLGVIVQPTWTFTRHFKKKKLKMITALNICKNLQELSLHGSVKYFNTMLKPIVVYAIESFWEDLEVSHFEMIDSCKWLFFKRVLGLHKFSRNRYVALLTGLPTLTEELVASGRCERTVAFNQYLDYVNL